MARMGLRLAASALLVVAVVMATPDSDTLALFPTEICSTANGKEPQHVHFPTCEWAAARHIKGKTSKQALSFFTRVCNGKLELKHELRGADGNCKQKDSNGECGLMVFSKAIKPGECVKTSLVKSHMVEECMRFKIRCRSLGETAGTGNDETKDMYIKQDQNWGSTCGNPSVYVAAGNMPSCANWDGGTFGVIQDNFRRRIGMAMNSRRLGEVQKVLSMETTSTSHRRRGHMHMDIKYDPSRPQDKMRIKLSYAMYGCDDATDPESVNYSPDMCPAYFDIQLSGVERANTRRRRGGWNRRRRRLYSGSSNDVFCPGGTQRCNPYAFFKRLSACNQCISIDEIKAAVKATSHCGGCQFPAPPPPPAKTRRRRHDQVSRQSNLNSNSNSNSFTAKMAGILRI